MISNRILVAAVAVLLFPATQVAAACNISQFSGPKVCGSAEVTGYIDVSQTASPLLNQESADAVAVGSSGGGPGTTGGAQASGDFGSAHIFATSSDGNVGFDSSIRSAGDISFVDGFTVGPNGLDLQFISSVDGTFLGFGAVGFVHFNLYSRTTNSFVLNDEQLFVYEGHPSQSETYSLSLSPGDYLFDWSMRGEATSANGRFGSFPSATIDLSHTGTLAVNVLTPGEYVTFLSGSSYGQSILSAVPEAATWTMMILGFVAVGAMARRRSASAALTAS